MSEFKYKPSKYVPFKDLEVIAKCRKLTREELVKHKNPDFKIRIVKDHEVFSLDQQY